MSKNPYLLYFVYLFRHKWFVFQECLKLGVPLWGALIHDWQKFTLLELKGYADYYMVDYGENGRPKAVKDAYELAWLHHIHHGPHHWEYWIINKTDESEAGLGTAMVLPMPDRYRREMLADWRGAGRAMHGKDETKEWYLANRNRILLHGKTRQWIESQLGI